MIGFGSVRGRAEGSADRSPVAVTILLLLVLGGQACEVREVASVAARAFSVAVAMAEEVECRAVVGPLFHRPTSVQVEAITAVRPAPRSRSVHSYAWPPPRAPSCVG